MEWDLMLLGKVDVVVEGIRIVGGAITTIIVEDVVECMLLVER
jgi:hypothetical protein